MNKLLFCCIPPSVFFFFFCPSVSDGRRHNHPREFVREFLDLRTQKWATFAAVWNEVCLSIKSSAMQSIEAINQSIQQSNQSNQLPNQSIQPIDPSIQSINPSINQCDTHVYICLLSVQQVSHTTHVLYVFRSTAMDGNVNSVYVQLAIQNVINISVQRGKTRKTK